MQNTLYILEKLLWVIIALVGFIGSISAVTIKRYVTGTDKKLDNLQEQITNNESETRRKFETESEKEKSDLELLRRDNREEHNIIFRQLDKKADKS